MAKDKKPTGSTTEKTGGIRWKRLAVIVVVVACLTAALRQYMRGGVCTSKARLDGKFVIITGANTGIGKETARDLTQRGARVLMACRSKERCDSAAYEIFHTTGHRPDVKLLDLADLDSVRQFSQDILDQEKRLDVLINNAGVMMCPRMESKQGYELQFATNHLGHFLLTNLLIPLLKRSAPSRVVVVSSLAHERGVINFEDINSEKEYGRVAAYAQSKLANILHSNSLAKKLEGTGVTVNSLHPGSIDTELTRHMLEILPAPVMTMLTPLTEFIRHVIMKTPMEGAQTNICCAVSEELANVSGKYFSDCVEKELKPFAKDEKVAEKLWEISEKMVAVK